MAEFQGYEMVAVGEPVRQTTRTMRALSASEVLVKVAGCGMCHTDLGFLYDGVPTRHPMPLILGHEISGFVVEAGADHADLVGKAVVVPAVIPCGECPECQAGRSMICKKQVMPGNDQDGGFATHVVVPGRGLCVVPGDVTDADAPLSDKTGITLRHLSVIADAVSTPYQALERAGVESGGVVIIIGLGGVGGYAAQLARARGAYVVGVDIDPRKLESPALHLALDPRESDARTMRKQVSAFAREVGAPTTRWTLLECSGSPAGQETAFGMMVHGCTLGVVGYTPKKVTLRLSNLMAFDARAIGNWGCAPEHYPAIVQLALDGAIDLCDSTEMRPLSDISKTFEDLHAHRLDRRVVLVP
jgi:6-hydroxycyclohex-1-ene-1-carbonyl-CoA dehydrogenase